MINIEDNIFKRYTPDFDKLKKYGFKKKQDSYQTEKLFKDNLFKAAIKITSEGKVTGEVTDIENNDEFLPLRVESNQGAYTAEVRQAYIELLTQIRDNCFIKNYYIYPQSNRITNKIIEKYGDYPEFLWEKFQGSGIFRNPDTKKWYLAILDVDRSKLQPHGKGLIEVADIKLEPEEIDMLLQKENFYPAYHMNKKYWITIILDDTVSDEKIMELISKSRSFTLPKRNK